MNGIQHIEGKTFHGRRGDIKNAFSYHVDYVLLDPELEVDAPSLFGRNKSAMVAVHDRDYGGEPKNGTGVAWARQALAEADIQLGGRILLLAQPRVLGHVFNPVSFWLCHDECGVLRVAIAEVTNTFGDRHSYLCHHDNFAPLGSGGWVEAQKIFHVSPFQPINGTYRFRFGVEDDKVNIVIDYRHAEGGVVATLVGERKRLTNSGIVRTAIKRPLGSIRVLALIYWQALKLKFKGALYRSRPEPPAQEVSR